MVELGEGVARRYRLNGIYGNERLWSTVEEIADKCNLIEGILVTISLIEKNQIHDAVYVYDVALNCLRVILEDQNGWRMNEEERWLMGVLMDRLQNYSELIISDGDKGGISRVFTGLFEKHDYLASKVAGLAVDMSRSIGVYEKEWAMRLIAKGYPPMEGACLLSEYFSDSQSQDTFFVEPAIEALGDIIERVHEYSWVTGFEVEDEVVEALKLCFVSIEQSLPVIRTRGHEKFLMNTLKGLFRNHPEAKDLVSDRLLDDIEHFRVRGARKIINHRGRHRGKYNTGDYE